MNSIKHNQLVERAADLFQHAEEGIYAVPLSYPFPYPVTYSPYDLGAAAFDAMIEDNPRVIKSGITEIVAKRNMIEAGIQDRVPQWGEIYQKRLIAAFVLNNYAGPDRPFNPN